jgi:DNA-directed RNA polymerase subunit alpha
MLDFQVPRISAESADDTRGSFTIEPLDRGFGYTFGNSLRRVLLSSSRMSSPRSRVSRRTSPTSS